jgi:hypothetical protein
MATKMSGVKLNPLRIMAMLSHMITAPCSVIMANATLLEVRARAAGGKMGGREARTGA